MLNDTTFTVLQYMKGYNLKGDYNPGGSDHEKMGKGVTLTEEELTEFKALLEDII